MGGEWLALLADQWRQSKRAERLAMLNLTAAIREARDGGMTEAQIVRDTQMNRMTVRKAMGR